MSCISSILLEESEWETMVNSDLVMEAKRSCDCKQRGVDRRRNKKRKGVAKRRCEAVDLTIVDQVERQNKGETRTNK